MSNRYNIVGCVVVVFLAAVFCGTVSGQESPMEEGSDDLEFPTVIIEGEELMRVNPADRVISSHGYSPKIAMPEKVREEDSTRYFYLEGAAGSENTGLFGCLGRFRTGDFALDVETRFLSTNGVRDDNASIAEQDIGLFFGTNEGPSLKLNIEYAKRHLDLLGPDWLPAMDDARDTEFKNVSAVFFGEFMAETTMDITMAGQEMRLEDETRSDDRYTKTGLEAHGHRGLVGFGVRVWRHRLDDVYSTEEAGGYLSVEDALLGDNVTASAGVRVQDYGENGPGVDPFISFKRPAGWGWSWETSLSRDMVVKDMYHNYATANYTRLNRTEFKPERNWRLETSFTKTVRRNLKLRLYGFGEDWKYPLVWDYTSEAGAHQGFYTLRQIEGYQTLGGGIRAEVEVRHGFRVFADSIVRNTEKHRDVAGFLPFLPRVEGEFGVEFELGRLTAVVDGTYRGERHYDMESDLEMEETVGIGGRLEYATEVATYFLEGKNLAAEEYLDVAGYPTAEQSYIVGMRLFF